MRGVLGPMSHPGPPTARKQLAFLRSLQRLMDEGSFVASYKFALLHAIADLCLVKGDVGGAELELSTSEIAEQFIRLYWPQVVPYSASAEQPILSQNTGRQAAIVRHVAEQRARYQGSLADLERSPSDWRRLLREVERTVRKMPLWKLQTVRSGRLEFLYENHESGQVVQLQPGIAYLFSGVLSNDHRHDRGSVVPVRPATQSEAPGPGRRSAVVPLRIAPQAA